MRELTGEGQKKVGARAAQEPSKALERCQAALRDTTNHNAPTKEHAKEQAKEHSVNDDDTCKDSEAELKLGLRAAPKQAASWSPSEA